MIVLCEACLSALLFIRNPGLFLMHQSVPHSLFDIQKSTRPFNVLLPVQERQGAADSSNACSSPNMSEGGPSQPRDDAPQQHSLSNSRDALRDFSSSGRAEVLHQPDATGIHSRTSFLSEGHLQSWLAALLADGGLSVAADAELCSAMVSILVTAVRQQCSQLAQPTDHAQAPAQHSSGEEARTLYVRNEQLKHAIYWLCHVLQAAGSAFSVAQDPGSGSAAKDAKQPAAGKRKLPGDRRACHHQGSNLASSPLLCSRWCQARSAGLAALACVYTTLRKASHSVLPQSIDKSAVDRLMHGCTVQLLYSSLRTQAGGGGGSGNSKKGAGASAAVPMHSAAMQQQLHQEVAAVLAQRLLMSVACVVRGASIAAVYADLMAMAQEKGDQGQKASGRAWWSDNVMSSNYICC